MLKLSLKNVQVAIAGKVLLAETDQPLANAKVEIIKMPVKCQRILQLKAMQAGNKWALLPERIDRKLTRGDGSFYFTNLPIGNYVIQASLVKGGTSYLSVTQAFNVKQKQNSTDLETAMGTLKILPTGLQGKVLAKGLAIAYAKIRAVESNVETLSDAAGNFRFVGLEASSQPTVFQISTADQPPQRRSVMLQQGVMTTIDFALE